MSPSPLAVFAQEPVGAPPTGKADPKDAIKSDSLWITVGLLALILLIGAVVVAIVDRWRKRTKPFEKESVEEVTNFRELYESGEITHGEYERIRSKMATRVKEKVGVKPAGPVGSGGPGATDAPGPVDNPPGGNPA